MTYGANGAAGTETSYGAAGGDNTGCGGQGGYYQSGNGGNGGSGIVVIKITALNELKDVTVETAPEEVTAKSGTTLGTISLTDGKAVDANGVEVPGKFAFADATYALKVTDDGKSFDVVFMPTDGATYKTATCQVVVTATATAKSAIEAVGASTTGTDDQPIYSFTTTTGTKTLTIPEGYKATVQLLVVGGGGGGGYANSTSTRYGNGGDGGQVLGGNNSTITRTVGAGETLNITVGAGGTAGTAAQGGNTNAQPGGYSSVTGGNSFGAEVKANGGSAGGNTQSSTNAKNGTGAGATAGSGTVTGIQSNLRTGSNVTYGEGGAKGSNSNPSAGGDNTGKGGGGARATSSNSSRRNGAAGGSGIVVIKVTSFEALPKEPVVESLSVTPVKRGDALSTSAITLTMGDPKTHANVPGDYDWKAPATVVSAPGEYPIVFTPTKAGYAEVEVMAQVSVIAPQEDDAEEVIDNGTSVAVTTTSFGGDWSATVVSGASYIETPELTVNDDDTATVTIKGKAIGTAVIDLYDGATWVKRITVAVMAPPIERTVELTMDIDDAAETVQTTTTATYWGNTIVSGADFVTATTAKSSGTGARIATTTITPKAYGTAVIEVRSGTSQAQLNTLVQRIIVTVAPPTEGSQTITVAQNASKVVKTASEIDSYEKVMTEGAASISSVTVGDREATIVASGTIGTAKVKLYKGDTLVKVVTVNVVDPTHTILTLCYAEVMEFTLTNATSVSWSATATDNVRLMTAATTAATSQNGSGASFTIKICGYTANGSGTVTVKQGQNTVMTYDCTVLADIAEDTTDGYNSIQSGKKSLSVYIGEPLNLSYYRQSATKWRFVDAEITSAMFTDRSKYTYKELGVFKATTSKGYTYSKGESGTASTSANLTSATSSDFDVKLEGVKTGTGPLAICFGANQPSHYAGYYDVTVWKPIAKPAATLSFTYDGEAKAPVASGEGYTVSGDATKTAAGTYTAIVMLDEYYCWPDHSTDPLVVEWTIEPAEITSATAANQTYTGSALTPELTVKAGGLDATYDLGAWNPDGLTDAGTYTATVTGKGNFTGSATVTFTINPKAVTVYPIATNKVYGAADPTIKYTVDPALVSGDELEGALARSAGEDVGAYDVLIGTLTNSNYKITLDATAVANAFTITQAKENVMTGKPTQQGWQAGETPVPADLGDVSAEFGMPVAVYYLDETCENSFVPSTETTAGIYYVRAEVAETANYAGAVSDSVAFEVTAVPDVDLANCDVTFDPPEAPYWGGQISVAYTVIDPEGVTLTEGTHFTAEWDPATIQDAGEYTLTLTAVDGSGYTGMKTADFTVIQAANWINGEPAQQGWQAGETPVPADLDDVSAEFGTPVAVYYLDETCENSFVPSTETAAGIYYVRAEVAETANYAGAVSDSVVFEVTAVPDVDLANCDVTFDPPEAPYWGGQIPVAYTVTDPKGVELEKDIHFTAAWDPATIQDAGEYTLTLTAVDGSGYTGMKTADFTVIQAANWINGEPAQQGWQAGETPVPADLDDVSAEFGTPVAVYYLDETCENSFTPSPETTAGIYYVRAEVAETANYAGAVSDSVAFEVTAAKVFTATFTKGEGVDSFTVAIDGAAAVAYTAPLTDLTNGTEIVLAVTPAAGYKYLGETMFTVNGADISETIAATEIVMTVNGVTYTTVEEALAALESEGGTALFNKASSIYEVFTFEKDTTLTVADGAWFVTNNLTLAATTVTNDISVSEKLTLAGNVTVGSDDYEATLAFGSIDNNGGTYKLTLTTNGVVQSATQLDDAVFAEVEHFHVAKKTIAGGFEYTLEATEFYVKYYDGDEVVYSNKFTILNYMTDLHVWDGTRDGLVLIGYTREDKTTKLDATDSALRDYVKDEADDPGCDGEVKVFGTWEQKIIPVNVPTAVAGLVYNGNEQTGVVENVGYTLTNNAKTDAGSYTATATLADGYIWNDGSSDPTNINWSIAKLAITVTPDAGQSKAKGVDYTITFTTDPDLAEGDAFTGALAIDSEQIGDCEIVQGTLAIDDDNGGANYDLTVASGVTIMVTDSQNVEPGQTTEVTPEKEPTTPEEVAAAEADALNKVKVVITDEEAKSAGQEDIVKEVAKYNSETKTVDVTLAIDTNSENYVEMDNAITDISTNLEDVVSGESSALKIPADEVTPGLYYNVIVEDENGNVTTGECALATSEGGVNLPVPEIDPNVTGLYFTVEQHLLKDGSDEGVVSKTLGYLGKEPTETEAIVRDFVGAPWGGMTDSEEIAVENFVKTENLKEGTKLYSYDEGKDAYNAWELDENKSWKPIKTYMMTDGKLTEQETKTADTAKIKRGKGAWIEHVKLDKKFVFVGDATRSEVAVPTTEGYNALSAKNFESLDLNDTLLEGASSKDSIIIPQAGSVPLVCTLKDGKWGYDSFTETEKKIGGQVQKVHTNTRVTNIKIPAGSAFWYVRGKTAK